jgi:pilus assembly protein CpaB
MNRRVQGILLVALLVAAVSGYAVWHVLGSTLAEAHKAIPRGVVAAAGNIKVGAVLSPSDLTTIQIAGTLPDGAFLDPKGVIGRGVVADIFKGEPILESRLACVGCGGGLPPMIPPGFRACAVKVDEVVGVSGFATPGMFVDVLISGTPPGVTDQTKGTEVRTLLQNLKVLSAGAEIQKDPEGKSKQVQVVNLLVTPDQAQILSLASSQAHIQLVLRNPLDTQTLPVAGNNMGNLFADPNAKPKPTQPVAVHTTVKHQAPEGYTVEVLQGSHESVEKFNAPEGKQ